MRAVVLFCGCVADESDESCVCRESERELDQITGNLRTRLTPSPTVEGRKWKKGKEESCYLKGRSSSDVWMRGGKSEMYCRTGYVITAGVM